MAAEKYDDAMMERLTDQERSVCKLLTEGMNTSEISKFLGLSFDTVAGLNASIRLKLGLKSLAGIRAQRLQGR